MIARLQQPASSAPLLIVIAAAIQCMGHSSKYTFVRANLQLTRRIELCVTEFIPPGL